LIHEYGPVTDTDSFIRDMSAPAPDIEGMAFDGTHLYVSTASGDLYTLDPDDGSVLTAVRIPGGGLFGLGAVRAGSVGQGGFETGDFTGSTITDAGPNNIESDDNSLTVEKSVILPEVDAYTVDFTGKGGHAIDIVLAGHDSAVLSGELLELLGADGSTVIATAVLDPLGGDAENYDLGILGFVIPVDGIYTIRFSSMTDGDYGMLVTDSLVFDTEPNDAVSDSLRSLDNTTVAMGHVGLATEFLEIYAERTRFETLHPGLPFEDFEESWIWPGYILSFAGPVQNNIGNGAFNVGDITPGISIESADPGHPHNEMVIVGSGVIGNASKAIGAYSLSDSTYMVFSDNDVFAVGMDILIDSPGPVNVTVFGPGSTVLATTVVNATTTGTFFGVAAGQPITGILVESPNGELIDNIAFGSFGGGLSSSGNAVTSTTSLQQGRPSEEVVPSKPITEERWRAWEGVVLPSGQEGLGYTIPSFYLPPQYHLFNNAGFLTEAASDMDPLTLATGYLLSNSDRLGLTASDLDQLIVTDQYTSSHTGVTHIYLRQTHQGLEVLNADMNVNVSSDGRIVSVGSSLVSGLGTLSVAGPILPVVDAREALLALAYEFGWSLNVPQPEFITMAHGANRSSVLESSGISLTDIPAKLQYVPTANGDVVLAWNLNVQTTDGAHWIDASVSADDGTLLWWSDWVDESSYTVFGFPVESPSYASVPGLRTVETDPANTMASPYGWHDIDGIAGAEYTTTQGNNVYAAADRNNDNMPDPGSSPDGGAALVFDFPLDLSQAPLTYRDASVANLYYWNNIIHDITYQYGFDEVSGNFQFNNYGLGGLGGDEVLADAQDGADVGSRNNANFATPPDGWNPRMQMYLFSTASPELDGDLDNGIIIHEYTHGISNRLTGGGSNAGALNTIQSAGMGEGWSDLFAMMLTQRIGDTALDSRPMGIYALNQPTTGGGVRSMPYSYDMTINTHTYGDIIGSGSVHFLGETWASALWDLNWLLIEGSNLDPDLPAPLGFDSNLYNGTGGNNMAMQLIMDGMKLQPSKPSFLDARDAILLADQVLNGGAYQMTIWKAFARRGMGYSAHDGGSSRLTAVTEAFDLPSDSQGSVEFDAEAYASGDVVLVRLSDLDLTGLGPVTVEVSSYGGDLETVTLTETTLIGRFEGMLSILGSINPTAGNGTLEVGLGNVITVTYQDSDDGSGSPATVTDYAIAVLTGPLGGDFYTVSLTAGEYVTIGTETPLDGPANSLLNDLDPEIIVYSPSGMIAALDQNSRDGKNAEVFFAASETGTHFIGVFAESGAGEYQVKIGPAVLVGGHVWLDRNGDGTQEAGEPGVENVTVHMLAGDGTSTGLIAATDVLGDYSFMAVPGTYMLEFVVPDDMMLTIQNAGSDDSVDSDPSIETGRTIAFVTISSDNLGWDAGLARPGSISGVLWNDLDANGQKDGGETLLTGWTVYLDTNGTGAFEEGLDPSFTTGADGRYVFEGLRPGTHVVREVMQEGWVQTYPGSSGIVGMTTDSIYADVYTFTGSSAEIFTPGQPIEDTRVEAALGLIELDAFRADARFSDVNGLGSSVVVIDTGIDIDHAFFGPDNDGDGVADRIIYQYDFADGDSDASDLSGHGSHVTSIIASSDAMYGGVVPEVNIIHLKVFTDSGSGYFSYAEQALQWVIKNADAYGVVAVNTSFGDGSNWQESAGRYGIADELATLLTMGI
ncbi:MAG: S8 family serine peptidase, partial [Phycisphaeraceae bacterium]|nr:S8 family serine peptidase [Phycisphaeraceae bacterium]